jgi:hypothetical protein
MSKKLVYLMSFVLVLAVTGIVLADQQAITVPDAGFDDHVLAEGDWASIRFSTDVNSDSSGISASLARTGFQASIGGQRPSPGPGFRLFSNDI